MWTSIQHPLSNANHCSFHGNDELHRLLEAFIQLPLVDRKLNFSVRLEDNPWSRDLSPTTDLTKCRFISYPSADNKHGVLVSHGSFTTSKTNYFSRILSQVLVCDIAPNQLTASRSIAFRGITTLNNVYIPFGYYCIDTINSYNSCTAYYYLH